MKQIKTYSQFVNEQKNEEVKIAKFLYMDGNHLYFYELDGKRYADVEGVLHSVTKSDEPNFPEEKYWKFKVLRSDKLNETTNQNIFDLPQIFQLFYDIEFDEFSGDITESEIIGLIKSENLQKIKLFSRELAEKIRNNEDSINKRNNVELLKLKYLIKRVIENLEDKDYLYESATIETISFDDVKDDQRGHGTLEITFNPSSREYSYVGKFENGKGDFRRPNEISGKWEGNDDLYNISKSDILQKFKEAKVNESNKIEKPTLINLYSEFIELRFIVNFIDKHDLETGYMELYNENEIVLDGNNIQKLTEIQKKNIARMWKEFIKNQQYEFESFDTTFETNRISFKYN